MGTSFAGIDASYLSTTTDFRKSISLFTLYICTTRRINMEATQQRGEVYYLGGGWGDWCWWRNKCTGCVYSEMRHKKFNISSYFSIFIFALTSYLIRTQHLFYSTNSFIYYLFAIVYIILSTQFTLYNAVAMAPHWHSDCLWLGDTQPQHTTSRIYLLFLKKVQIVSTVMNYGMCIYINTRCANDGLGVIMHIQHAVGKQ